MWGRDSSSVLVQMLDEVWHLYRGCIPRAPKNSRKLCMHSRDSGENRGGCYSLSCRGTTKVVLLVTKSTEKGMDAVYLV